MTDMQGALGCAQMQRVQSIITERSRRAKRYDEMLEDIEWLQTPVTPNGCEHGYQSYTCLFRPENPALHSVQTLHAKRNALMEELASRGIAVSQGTHAPFMLSYYAKKYAVPPEQLPQSYIADRLSITLPLYPQMTAVEQEYVVEQLKEAFATIAPPAVCSK